MAEAIAHDHMKYYCHMCNIRFESCSPAHTCPQCADGFIERVESQLPESDSSISAEYGSDSDDEMFDMLNMRHNFALPGFGRIRSGADPRGSDAAQIERPMNHYQNLIHEFIVNLGVGVNMFGGNGNMQLFLNPGDYAWGREGLDTIVTQLLNQIDTTGFQGPPPLAKAVIDAIPVVEVTQEQVDIKLKCSVCWEEFQLTEKVRQLACQHVYHEPCIRPWLELHSTCPICRQDLGPEGHAAVIPAAENMASNHILQHLLSMNTSSSSTSGSSSTNTESSTSSSSSSGSSDSS